MAQQQQPLQQYERLRAVIASTPIVDNHAHNLLLPGEYSKHPFHLITTEAQGSALQDTFTSLAHLRAVRQLRELYDPDGAHEHHQKEQWNWEQLLSARAQWLSSRAEELIGRCLAGTHAILMDDGLGNPDSVYPYDYHDRFTQAHTRRVVRIETLAEAIMVGVLRGAKADALDYEDFMPNAWKRFTEHFETDINAAIDDPEVAGFKSVICYRTGLDIDPDYDQALLRAGKSFEHYVQRVIDGGHRAREYRFDRKPLNVYIVLKTCELLSEHPAKAKPFQFHTGLGDFDIDLRRSNPSYLQALIEEYPVVPIVILHAAYPFTREAAYLATVYKNVYLDVGEVFPQLSRDGQESALRQAFELTPAGKLMYSTDGHLFPETYWLANKQFRQALAQVLVEYVSKGDISETAAIGIAQDIMYNNANTVYRLGYEPQTGATLAAGSRTLALPSHPPASQSQALVTADAQRSVQTAPVTSSRDPDTPINKAGEVKYVAVQWVTYVGQIRSRFIQNNKGIDAVVNESFGISRGNIATLQNDGYTPAVNTTGQIYVKPDPRTVKTFIKKDQLGAERALFATVMSSWVDENGVGIRECPRSNLQRYVDELEHHFGTRLLVGFEIEVTFLKRSARYWEETDHELEYTPLTHNHSWGSFTSDDWNVFPFLADVGDALKQAGIPIQQFHSESGAGQYEFVLLPDQPVLAVDTLYQARQIIQLVADSAGYRATFHASPVSGVGNSSHVHISLNPRQNAQGWHLEAWEPHFWAGVLAHLDAICAFSLPERESYSRVTANRWSGGEWISWGTQNRETPLRKVGGGRWEVRCLDGFANMYLALGAIVAAGIVGLRERAELTPDCPANPDRLSDAERAEYGINRRLPKTIDESLAALERDTTLREALADGVFELYLTIKRAEQQMLSKQFTASDDDKKEEIRRAWFIERY